ncbi:MAG: nucleotidyltransferase [Marinifilaceae bacterium]
MLEHKIKNQFNEMFSEIAKNLDITESQYKAAVQSYQAVGSWLAERQSKLSPYSPEVLPQGSFLLGTMIKPVIDTDELDVDLVCKLIGKNRDWTQYNVKQIVGDRIKENTTYKQMLDEEGRRCWTLIYSASSKYHMDILPAIVGEGYSEILEKAISSSFSDRNTETAIRITDNQEDNYRTDANPDNWHKSNPFGYAVWFQNRCSLELRKAMFVNESIKPLPSYQKDKLPLQRAIQILKRHRDLMFKGDDDKPISIIITTLSAKAYQKETDVISALDSILARMSSYIEERYSLEYRRMIKWISNPVNDEENFADKWPENPNKEKNFYSWLSKVKIDLAYLYEQRGMNRVQESFSKSFGENLIKKSFSNMADRNYYNREKGSLFMDAGTGVLGASQLGGIGIKSHNFHGED